MDPYPPVLKYRLPMSAYTDKLFWRARHGGRLNIDTYDQDELWECMLGAASGGKLELLIELMTRVQLSTDGIENLAWKAAESGRDQILLHLCKQVHKLKCCCEIMWNAYENKHLTVLMYFTSICKHYETRNAIVKKINPELTGAEDLLNALYYEDFIDPDPSIQAVVEWERIKSSYMELWQYFTSRPTKQLVVIKEKKVKQPHDDIYRMQMEIEREEKERREKRKKRKNRKKR